eukprot:CAMPEP_0184870360 /NCGR_PEP_ID=MMETSP0580-20130426/37202_1 /TAXON_ID=1118495 /ORGANISM="Dactyliosolen fragilissimus" /LENGTH=46 /DNA_ID= /DNA_START= /DNA_END= /DNA_ORIENTATION=
MPINKRVGKDDSTTDHSFHDTTCATLSEKDERRMLTFVTGTGTGTG